MLTEYKDLRPKKGVNKPSENVFMSVAYSEIFSGRGTQIRHTVYFKRSFSGRIILKHVESKKTLWGVRGHVPPENF